MSEKLEAAARSLHDAVFDGRHDRGSVMMGVGRLEVFVYGKYYGTKPQIWKGYRVKWHTDCGFPTAQAAGSPALGKDETAEYLRHYYQNNA